MLDLMEEHSQADIPLLPHASYLNTCISWEGNGNTALIGELSSLTLDLHIRDRNRLTPENTAEIVRQACGAHLGLSPRRNANS